MAGQLARYVRITLALIFIGAAGAITASVYYVLLALSLESSRTFAPQSAFATVAAYRVFDEQSLPLPTFTSGAETRGPPCFTAGMPTPGLAAGMPCRSFIEFAWSPVPPLPCSTWKREICTIIELQAPMYRNEVFQGAFQRYVSDPCRFVEDYRQLRDRLDASAVSTLYAASYARSIENDFRCATAANDRSAALPVSNVWRYLRTYLLLRGSATEPDHLIEVRIRPLGAGDGRTGRQ